MKLEEFLENHFSLVVTEVNRFYLTGFRSSLGYLFLCGKKSVLYVDGRYIEAAKNSVNPNVEVRLLNRLCDAAREIESEFKFTELYLESDITVREQLNLSNLFCEKKVVIQNTLSDLIAQKRSIKTDKEIENIISAQRCAEKSFQNILNFLKPGVTERQIALELDYYMQKSGASGMSFETIAVSGSNSSKPHGVPSEKPIQNGEFITMDFGAVYDGYCSDMTRTVALDYVTDKMAEVYNTVLAAQKSAISSVSSGKSAAEVDKAARSVIESAGFGNAFTHSTGHGVGLEIHESPNLSTRSNYILQSGNIVTCEPGIYLEGEFGVRIEDMLVVTQNGAKNITNSQKNLIIIK